MIKIRYHDANVEEWLLKGLSQQGIKFEKAKIKYALNESVGTIIYSLIITPILEHLSVEAFKYVIRRIKENIDKLDNTNLQIPIGKERIDIDHNLDKAQKIQKLDNAVETYTSMGTIEREKPKPSHDYRA
jgi:hypothetical protein